MWDFPYIQPWSPGPLLVAVGSPAGHAILLCRSYPWPLTDPAEEQEGRATLYQAGVAFSVAHGLPVGELSASTADLCVL